MHYQIIYHTSWLIDVLQNQVMYSSLANVTLQDVIDATLRVTHTSWDAQGRSLLTGDAEEDMTG